MNKIYSLIYILLSVIYILLSVATALLLVACASISTPQGGPRDERPPRLVAAYPAPGSKNVDRRQMYLEFDEFITLKDAFNNVTVSPTSESQPRVSGVGKRVSIQFADSLLDNTTYTIDFGNAIQDNNEGNAIEGFTYTFSTGPDIDTLRISGIVLDSRTLEPQQGIIVGVHTSEADTAFSKVRLERVARTDDHGRFTLRGLSQGPFRLFALKDLNGDFRWDNPEEQIAFFPDWITPTAQPTQISDTIYNVSTLAVDSVIDKNSTIYLPNDILLSSFSLGYKPQYLKSSERPDSVRAVLIWNAPQDSLPAIRLLKNPSRPLKDWATAEVREGNDSITLWLRDTALIHNDTLRLEVQYMRNKSRGVWEVSIDTLTLLWKHPKVQPSTGKKKNKPKPVLLDVKGSETTHDFPKPFTVTFGTPVDTIFFDRIRLEQKIDTTWVKVRRDTPLLVRADTLNPRVYELHGPWNYDGQYRLMLDTLAVRDIYGHSNKPEELGFRVRKADDYAALSFTITDLDGLSAFVELLDGSDRIVRTEQVVNGVADFRFLQPSTYYARIIYDLNGNGRYDTGDYDTGLQPEPVAYYPKKITLKKNWDQNISWQANATPVDMQKPAAVKKNKPKKKRGDKQQQEVEEEEEEYFDPNENPFDPNSRRNRQKNNRRNY